VHGASIGGGGGGGGGVVPLVLEGAPPSRGAGWVPTTSSAVGPGSPGFRAKVGWLYRKGDAADGAGFGGGGAAAVASFLAAVLTEIYLCNVCSCPKLLRRNGRGQAGAR
jgi:hypothetical protein